MSKEYKEKVKQMITHLRGNGLTLKQTADELNRADIFTPLGKKFNAQSVAQLIQRNKNKPQISENKSNDIFLEVQKKLLEIRICVLNLNIQPEQKIEILKALESV